jgi:multidrug resistance efflux pump
MKWILITLAGVAAAGVGAWWLAAGSNQTDAAEQGTYATVQRRDVVAAVGATGKVNAMVGAEVRVGSRVSGLVRRLHANIGDVVRTGQIIAELERDDQEALLEQRRAELKVAEAHLSSVGALRPGEIQKAEAAVAEAEATADLARTVFTRQNALAARGLVAKESLDSARKERDVTEARVMSARRELELAKQRYVEDLKSANAQVEQASAAVRVLDVQVSYAVIRTPVAGIISSVSTQEGETVAASMSSPIFVTVIDLHKLQVDAFVDETDIGRIRVGQKATFTVDSYPDRDFSATVQAIYPKAVIVDNVVYYDVVLHIDESLTGELRPEMTTNVMIALDTRKGVLAAPLQAVSREQGQYVVYVLRDGQPTRQTVKVGSKDAGWFEIVSGLEEHDKVLVRGTPKPAGGS